MFRLCGVDPAESPIAVEFGSSVIDPAAVVLSISAAEEPSIRRTLRILTMIRVSLNSVWFRFRRPRFRSWGSALGLLCTRSRREVYECTLCTRSRRGVGESIGDGDADDDADGDTVGELYSHRLRTGSRTTCSSCTTRRFHAGSSCTTRQRLRQRHRQLHHQRHRHR